MRQIATLPEDQARTLVAHLQTLQIETQLNQEPDGWAVWVCDEDRLPQAKQELEQFQQWPDNPRFQRPVLVAQPIPVAAPRLPQPLRDPRRLTVALITVCVAVAIGSNLGRQDEPILQALYIAPFEPIEDNQIQWRSLSSIFSGQVWRLLTPIFVHLGFWHLLFNCLVLLYLGGLIETKGSSLRLLVLVLVLALATNLAEYYLGRTRFSEGRLTIGGSPQFGGMSGVLFGLGAYAWVMGMIRRDKGLSLAPGVMPFMILWMLAGFTGRFGQMANAAHVVGLLVGAGLAVGQVVWEEG